MVLQRDVLYQKGPIQGTESSKDTLLQHLQPPSTTGAPMMSYAEIKIRVSIELVVVPLPIPTHFPSPNLAA